MIKAKKSNFNSKKSCVVNKFTSMSYVFPLFPPVYPMVAVKDFPQENLVFTFDPFTLLSLHLQL